MRKPRILVTGATGSIGGRLVEMLMLGDRADVCALVRSWPKATRLARFPVELVKGDIGCVDDLRRAVGGCDIVVHCAYDTKSPERNRTGAEAIVDVCLDAGVQRLVALGSLAVYEPLPDGTVDESSPRRESGWTYADTKLAVERFFEEAYVSTRLPVVIVEPTIVFGPFSTAWTSRPVRHLRTRRVVLPDDGDGLCNAVYVDDVVESLILAMEADEAVGRRILVSGDAPVTWRRFYHAFEEMLGVRSLVFRPAAEIEHRAQALSSGNASSRMTPRAAVLAAAGRVAPLLGGRFVAYAKARVPPPILWPDEQGLALYRAKAAVRIDEARRLLGYEPRVTFETGMERTTQYVRWARL